MLKSVAREAGAQTSEMDATGEPAVPPHEVSVVIPAYRGAATIRRCLAALANQASNARPSVIVVESSGDGAADVVARDFPWVRVVREPERLSAGAARNRGAALATGRYVLFVDQDCIVPRDWIARMVGHLRRPGVDAVGGSIGIANPANMSGNAVYFLEFLHQFPGRGPVRLDAPFLLGSNAGYRVEVLRAVQFPDRTLAEDVLFTQRVRQAGFVVAYDPSLTVLHHNRSGWGEFLSYARQMGRASADYHASLDHPWARPFLRWPAIIFPASLAISPVIAFRLLGAVVLVTTGAEALYADIGHFGLKPIRLVWYAIALPALLVNYFGQGALALSMVGSEAIDPKHYKAFNPFYELAPEALRLPLTVLSTVAAIIASQAVISGVFSMARQAMRMNYLPRLEIIHTSHSEEGQIYLPMVNLLMLVGCVITVLWFESSTRLASAYGIAVTATFGITTVLLAYVARRLWRWRRWQVALLAGSFLLIDLAFLSSNLLKLGSGGWFALAVGIAVAVVMSTWMQGSYHLGIKMSESAGNIHEFLAGLWSEVVPRVPGTAVFLTTSSSTPFSLAAFVEHSHVLHRQVILLSVHSVHVPVVSPKRQVKLEWMPDGFWKLTAQCGFMETPDVPRILERAREQGLEWDPVSTTYFARRMAVLPTGDAPMARWRKRLFAHLSASAVDSTRFFNLPPDRVVEFGVQMEL